MKRIWVTIGFTVIVLCLLLNYNIFDYMQLSRSTLSRYGSRGSEVTNIQSRLRSWGYYTGWIDGIYGYSTYTSVKYFQRYNGLTADGIAGPRTLSALGLPTGTYTGTGTTTSTYSTNVNLLAHLITGEARGEPYRGQVAVGAVILNRVGDSRFPKTIAGVIYSPGAFDAVADGQINMSPLPECRNAAIDALNGWDPSYSAVYYFNPSTATNKWIWSRPQTIEIGNHIFAR